MQAMTGTQAPTAMIKTARATLRPMRGLLFACVGVTEDSTVDGIVPA